MSTVWLDGNLVPEDGAGVSVRDRGLLLGDSVFETIAVYRGQPFRLDEHLARLERSAQLVLLSLPTAREEFASAVRSVIDANRLERGSVRLTVTRGSGPPGIALPPAPSPTVLVTTSEARDLGSLQSEGVDVIATRTPKIPTECIPAEAKTGNYLNGVLARAEAQRSGAFEAVLCHVHGDLAEATTANVFCVIGGKVYTPPADGRILPGLVRAEVFQIGAELGIPVLETRLHPDRLLTSSEVWLTNSLIEIVPVRSVEELPLPRSRPFYERFIAAYRERVARG